MEIRSSPVCAEFGLSDQTVRAYRRSLWKIWPLASRLSRSFKVIGTDTDRSATHDFLLTFRNNHGPISYRFRDKRRFQSKIAEFSHPREFCTHAEGVPLELDTGARSSGSKTRMMGLLGRERSLTISSFVWIQYSVTDRLTERQTDGTDTGRQQRPRLRLASSGKKRQMGKI